MGHKWMWNASLQGMPQEDFRVKVDPASGPCMAHGLYKKLYFGFGQPGAPAMSFGDVLPELRRTAAEVRTAR